jgi:ribonuclease VapC
MSAATLTEVLIVSGRRGLANEVSSLLTRLAVTVVPIFEADARRAAEAYALWGKGMHPAGLNFGDCFAYALAKERGCPLLYVGNDFAQTDIQGVNFAEGAPG